MVQQSRFQELTNSRQGIKTGRLSSRGIFRPYRQSDPCKAIRIRLAAAKNSARPNELPRAWKMRVTAPEHDARPNGTAGWIFGSVSAPGPGLGERVVRMSSSLVAPSAIAILSTALLCGLSSTAVSQTATGSATPLPSITVEAPKQTARPPQREERAANIGTAHRRGPATRTTAQTAGGTPSAARAPVMAKLARLEREASSCNDGCESSFRRGKDPWVGCSESAGYYSVFSATCKDTLTHRDYVQCVETKMFLGWDRGRSWWYCTSMLAGGKFRVTAENRNR